MCRVIDAFVETLVMSELGFERSQAAETGRPGYDPRDLLKLYLYGYLNQIRSSRRLETECRRALELDSFQVVADAGYSNGEQVAHCEAAGMMPYATNLMAIPMSALAIRDCCGSTPIIKTVTPCIRLRLMTAEPVR
jgi:hypothetical protein